MRVKPANRLKFELVYTFVITTEFELSISYNMKITAIGAPHNKSLEIHWKITSGL